MYTKNCEKQSLETQIPWYAVGRSFNYKFS